VDLTLREMTSQQQLEAFDEGQLDVGFAWPLPTERSKEFHEEIVYTEYPCLYGIPLSGVALRASFDSEFGG
jgi:DNA-binding transcriptional LysR family regulator